VVPIATIKSNDRNNKKTIKDGVRPCFNLVVLKLADKMSKWEFCILMCTTRVSEM